jgi:hypothetical protein
MLRIYSNMSKFSKNNSAFGPASLRWGYVDSPLCDCEAAQQTMSHIVNECPIRRFNGGLVELSDFHKLKCDFHTHECDFGTFECGLFCTRIIHAKCDFNKLECHLYTHTVT